MLSDNLEFGRKHTDGSRSGGQPPAVDLTSASVVFTESGTVGMVAPALFATSAASNPIVVKTKPSGLSEPAIFELRRDRTLDFYLNKLREFPEVDLKGAGVVLPPVKPTPDWADELVQELWPYMVSETANDRAAILRERCQPRGMNEPHPNLAGHLADVIQDFLYANSIPRYIISTHSAGNLAEEILKKIADVNAECAAQTGTTPANFLNPEG